VVADAQRKKTKTAWGEETSWGRRIPPHHFRHENKWTNTYGAQPGQKGDTRGQNTQSGLMGTMIQNPTCRQEVRWGDCKKGIGQQNRDGDHRTHRLSRPKPV